MYLYVLITGTSGHSLPVEVVRDIVNKVFVIGMYRLGLEKVRSYVFTHCYYELTVFFPLH